MELAIDHFNKLLDFNDKNPEAHYQLADCYQRLRRYDKAERHGLIALLLKDVSLEHEYYVLGLTYDKKQQYKDALKYYTLCLKENPKKIEAAFGKAGVIDKYYEDKEAVIKNYEQFITDFKSDRRAFFYVPKVEKRLTAIKEELFLKAGKD